ncbi:MAG TPA: hypothetical protein PKA20_17425 [Burkholderiaceae bacterium]|nr:hypothetical protein [Burkholderiaceae bacterium]
MADQNDTPAPSPAAPAAAPAPAAPPPAEAPRGHADTVVVTAENMDQFFAERIAAEQAASGQQPAAAADDPDADADADADDDETDEQRTERRRKPIAERLRELSRQRNAERQRRAQAEQQLEQLRAQPPAAAPAAPAAAEPPAAPAAAAPPPAAAAEDPEPDAAQYTDAFEYARDLAKWQSRVAVREALAARDAEQAQQREQQRAQQVVQTFQQRMQTFRAATADFDAVVGGSVAPTSDHVRNAIIESDNPGPLVYHLARNPQLLAEIQALPPASQARRIGRLEAELAGPPAAAPAPASAPRRAATPPPAPIEPLRGANGAADLPLSPTREYIGTYEQYKRDRLAGRIR